MRTKGKPRTLSIGSVSDGTLRPEDLVPAILWDLKRIRLSREDRKTVQAIDRASDLEGYYDGEIEDADPSEDLSTLEDIAGNYVPDYCYFGSTDGDGAAVGVWPSWDAIEEARRSRELPSGDQLPDGKPATDHFLVVSDHGNGTLYRKAGTRWIECWGAV